MTALRCRVRLVAFVWLLCQAGSLAAFVPEECCISHTVQAAAKEQAEACHETDAAPEPQPQHGDMCPMDHHGSPATGECAISNACKGPGAHLLTLFALITTLDEPLATSTVLESTSAFLPSPPPLLSRRALPDAPPPKS